MTAAGEEKPGEGYEPHHMIATDDKRADDLRTLLANAGIDINSAENGVWLPKNDKVTSSGESAHNETMRDSYFDYLTEKFRGTDGTAADIHYRLNGVKNYLLSGRVYFPKK